MNNATIPLYRNDRYMIGDTLGEHTPHSIERGVNSIFSAFARTGWSETQIYRGQMVEIIGLHIKDNYPIIKVKPIDANSTLLSGYAIATENSTSFDNGYLFRMRQISYYCSTLVYLRENVNHFCGIGRNDGLVSNNGFGFYVSTGDPDTVDATLRRKCIRRIRSLWDGVGTVTRVAYRGADGKNIIVDATWEGRTINVKYPVKYSSGDSYKEFWPNLNTGDKIHFYYFDRYDSSACTGQIYNYNYTQSTAATQLFLGDKIHLDAPIGAACFFANNNPVKGWETLNVDRTAPTVTYTGKDGQEHTIHYPNIFNCRAFKYPKKRIANE